MSGRETVEVLVDALAAWHAQLRRAEAGTDPAWNVPAPCLAVRLAVDGDGQPGEVLAEVVLTARHADELAWLTAADSRGMATSSAPVLSKCLDDRFGAYGEPAVCWLLVDDTAAPFGGQVPLSIAGAADLAAKLTWHGRWLTVERAAVGRLSRYRAGERVRVVNTAQQGAARGRSGTVTQVKLVPDPPGPDLEVPALTTMDLGDELPAALWYCVRLDNDPCGYTQTFLAEELAAER